MAASIYATPPPDLSSEDTALSDVSNSSSLNNRSNNSNSNSNSNNNNNNNNTTDDAAATETHTTTTNNKKPKRTIADVLMDNTSQPLQQLKSSNLKPANTLADMGSSANTILATNVTNTDLTSTQNATAAMAAVAAAANAAMQLKLLEAISDAAKKRRKQNNPSRLDALNVSGEAAEGNEITDCTETMDENSTDDLNASTLPIDYEEQLSKMFLPKSMEQLKETFHLLQQQQQQQLQQQQQQLEQIRSDKQANISPIQTLSSNPKEKTATEDSLHFSLVNDVMKNPYQTYCKECGENFENELKLGVHMIQEHGTMSNENANGMHLRQKNDTGTFDALQPVSVKIERPDFDSPSSSPQAHASNSQHENAHLAPNGKEPWMNSLPGMTFPFPPDAAAAAALSASGYLPLLGVPGFPPVDGLNRPPLRIFNPEAYCDLCNKEFCNKYFLKTHKANKHGIYDPAISSTNDMGMGNSSGMNTMNPMFQFQIQQQHIQQQQQIQQHLQQKQHLNLEVQQQQHSSSQAQTSLNIPQQITPPAPPTIYCDLCSKRFTNIFAMRRHRAKAHEQSLTQRNSPNEQPQQSPEATEKVQDIKSDTTGNSSSSETNIKQFQMPEDFRQDFTLEQEEVSFTPQPRKLSPQSQQQAREANFAHDKLKRLGVLNPEAFCELCCKEYCNKYFLRTHKWKRHGIFVPPDELKEDQLQLAQKFPWALMNMPGMPLNFMMASEKAVMAQRMLAAAAAANNSNDSIPHMSKRIKLELNDDITDENQDNKSETNRAQSELQQQMSAVNMTTIQESQKILGDTNLPASPEAAMGLQKLQTMIQQWSDMNGKRALSCHICGRELENQYALHAHMMTEHAGGMDGNNAMPLSFQQHIFQQQQALKLSPTGSPGSLPLGSDLRCNQCDRDFNTLQEFKQHFAEVHLLPGSPLRDGFVTPERPINPNSAGGTRPLYTITPTSSYCEICNKELCNKYFMKTHMQRMHGIEIENGAQIGGVVCNICNKELCSKYFLKVHKQNTHGIMEEGSPLPQPRQNGLGFETQQQQQQIMETELGRGVSLSPFGGPLGNIEVKSEATDGRYYNNYSEICPICTRRFRNAKWLRAHLLSDHGTAGVEKVRELDQQMEQLSKPSSPTLKIPNGASSGGSSSASNLVPNPASLAQALQNLNTQHLLSNVPKNVLPGMFGNVADQAQTYQCSMCPFTTPYYAFLFIHERSHSILNTGENPNIQQETNANAENGDESATISEIKEKEATETAIPLLQEKTEMTTKTKTEVENMENSTAITEIRDKLENMVAEIATEPKNLSIRTTTPLVTEIENTTTAATIQPTVKEKEVEVNVAETLNIKTEEEDGLVVNMSSPNTVKNAKQQSANLRSAATSPVVVTQNTLLQEHMLQDIANATGKIACFALPKGMANAEKQQMQPFVIESVQHGSVNKNEAKDSGEHANNDRFVPAIIYLPVKERVTGPITVSFNLTPA
ncbi:uncharacterized protein LOC119681425 [Teleopsis dalmanni]|uniref:uncharacterized protein LOC119681425 n=1 Tax=Teleopsis dalmanni TaxID=139649 RepID=UPI0018CDD4D9|nr:uncharacterized protein LOC119681425 [Teleopsis dalmanni]